MAVVLSACSPARMATNRMAGALTDTASAYASDNDPEFVRLAAPSTLKMVEMLLDSQPAHEGLLLTACSGFTQYAYAFVQADAEILPEGPARAETMGRARAMYGRAREYCWRALDGRYPGVKAAVTANPETAAARLSKADVPLVYWLGVSWAGELAIDDRQLQRLEELVAVRVLLGRALLLDERWNDGAIHEAFIALDGMSALLGGSATRARQHFDRAVELSQGQSAFAFVTFASSVSVRAGNRAQFDELLKTALAIDVNRTPHRRLANLIAQREARGLLSRAPALFPSGR